MLVGEKETKMTTTKTARTPEWVSPCGRATITRALMGYWLTIDGDTVRVTTLTAAKTMATEHLNGVTL